jgi:hypothetical protein
MQRVLRVIFICRLRRLGLTPLAPITVLARAAPNHVSPSRPRHPYTETHKQRRESSTGTPSGARWPYQ